MNDVRVAEWKKYLNSLPVEGRDFNRAMQRLDRLISTYIPSTKGMIWRRGQVNPAVSIADVTAALELLAKFGQANLDDLGSPSEPDRLSGTPLNSLFISQEDSKLDEWNPNGNQNQGVQGSTTPKNNLSSGKEKSPEVPEKNPNLVNIDERMRWLTKLIDEEKK